jgi:KRAB domain-containing zinc finger protein
LESKDLLNNGEAALCNRGGHWEVLREELGIMEEDIKLEESFEIEEVELVVKLEGPREEPFGCRDCEYVGPSKRALGDHRRKYHPVVNYECPACGNGFETQHGLSKHLAMMHAEEVDEDGDPYVVQPHVCQCGKRYGSKHELTTHLRKTGHGGGEHECPGCELSFDTPHGLTAHLAKKHANDVDEDGEPLLVQPHACKLCRKTYGSKKHLSAHRRAAHDIGEFDCSICQQSFETPRGLSTHLAKKHGVDVDDDGEFLVYKPFRCQDCGKGYTLKESLTKHRRKKHTKSQRRPHDDGPEPPIPPMAPKRRRT